ncbi:DUF6708 domain-containing protein [Morganella psychrotolerans]|uniref:DUF6708 domain-containing protein n=1 Tax=Morganella psychrotolerans TaxID=368603 RepID=UPI0039AF888B
MYIDDRINAIFPAVFFLSAALAIIIFLFYCISKECFIKTHYPIRFDRSKRMVYAYKTDGTIISVLWDEIYFTSGLGRFKTPMDDYYLSGHILSEDKETIIDTFCLPESDVYRKDLIPHWKFIRRYMKEGVEPVIDSIKYYVPIDNKKETPKESYVYLLAELKTFTFFLFPFGMIAILPIWLLRCLAIHFSKLTVWPEDIESQCEIDKEDPYQRDASFNKQNLWKGWFLKGYGSF